MFCILLQKNHPALNHFAPSPSFIPKLFVSIRVNSWFKIDLARARVPALLFKPDTDTDFDFFPDLRPLLSDI
jgi:hypothetical protein